jgi:KDO2-lipid IV(A) lauroyltransferase
MYAYVIYKLGAFLAQRLSLPTARRLAAVVGRLMCLLQRRNRRHLYRNLVVAFGSELGPRELKRLRRRIFANFAAFVADYLWLPKISRDNIAEFLTPESLGRYAELRRLSEEHGPVIYLTAHLGNWELGGVTASLLGMPLTVLVDAHPSPLVTRFFDARREEKGMTVVPVTAFQKVFRAIQQKQLVAIVGDRPVTGQGILATFFGRPALVPDGHALLARRFGASIVPGFLVMRKDGRYELIVEDVIEPRVTDDEEADIRECVERCLAVFERYIRRYPEQWYVFRPVWARLDRRQADRLEARQARLTARAAQRKQREAARAAGVR